MRSASEDERLRLIRAHPELAGRAELTDESTCEQKGACFAQRNVEEFKRMQDTLYEPFAMGRFPRSAKTRRAAIAAEKARPFCSKRGVPWQAFPS